MSGRRFVTCCGAIIIIFASNGCKSGNDKIYKESKVVMGTIVEITVAHDSEAHARAAIKEAMSEFQRIEDLMSSYKQGSAIDQLNRGGSRAGVPVGREVFDLLQHAADVSRASGGAFDATIWPISRLWGFDQGGRIPPAREIEEKGTLVGYGNVKYGNSDYLVGFAVDDMGVDLGAIAKGWAVDKAMERLSARGIRNAIVDAGGDLRVAGARPGKKFWRIGVQHPREPGTLMMTLDLTDIAIVTSGDYERFFIADGVRYHHILDPATGQPARGCQSVTVLAPTAAEADACSTAAFVLGPTKGLAFLRGRPGVRGVIVGADGEMHWTDDALARLARH